MSLHIWSQCFQTWLVIFFVVHLPLSQLSVSTSINFPKGVVEWNTILLTAVNRWLYDCLFLPAAAAAAADKLRPPDFYDPQSTFVTRQRRWRQRRRSWKNKSFPWQAERLTRQYHSVWKSIKKSHSTFYTFTFRVDKSFLKMPKIIDFEKFFKLAVKQYYQTGHFQKDKNW